MGDHLAEKGSTNIIPIKISITTGHLMATNIIPIKILTTTGHLMVTTITTGREAEVEKRATNRVWTGRVTNAEEVHLANSNMRIITM